MFLSQFQYRHNMNVELSEDYRPVSTELDETASGVEYVDRGTSSAMVSSIVLVDETSSMMVSLETTATNTRFRLFGTGESTHAAT